MLGVLRQIIQRWCVFLKIRAVAYAHDGYIKAKLSVAIDVLSDLKRVLKVPRWRSVPRHPPPLVAVHHQIQLVTHGFPHRPQRGKVRG